MLIATTSLMAQHAENKARKSAHETVSRNGIEVKYGRPQKKGRVIFGSGKDALVPYGQVWRTGTDEATEITVPKDCLFAGQQLKAGTYTLFTIPGEKEWTVILNKKTGQWGAYEYEKVKDQNVLTAKVPATSVGTPVEQFTIQVEDAGIRMEWDNVRVFIPVKNF